MAHDGLDGLWSVKTSSGTAASLLSLERGGVDDGVSEEEAASRCYVSLDTAFLAPCPKISNVRNTTREATKIFKHFHKTEAEIDATPREGDAKEPKEKEKDESVEESGGEWVVAKLDNLARSHSRILIHLQGEGKRSETSGGSESLRMLSSILRKAEESKQLRGKAAKRKRKREKSRGPGGREAWELEGQDILSRTRYCQRIFPVQTLCLFTEAAVQQGLRSILGTTLREYKSGGEEGSGTAVPFSVWCRQRLARVSAEGDEAQGEGQTKSLLDVLATTFQACCSEMGLEGVVNLKTPKLVVLAEGSFQSADGVAFVPLSVCPVDMVQIKSSGTALKTLFDVKK
ncbi:hypothetical protein HOP50_19g83490 [Chloropicon primus]|uniref:Uncharacterized protein n=1 Tax=Chloropicon primus TaxID=1764295 RepID=A0A5B8MYX7_9CHLO|nr:hypothetical protein A3770_19p83250 [Chloropicon primus]UPR05002.1 hypothetical protein HOP50_19g83490 [Chloropicon primus]|eukprot:QDZ25807.1 hypothetical protein A3770_19p83250 [Chloropicon primus]